MTEGNDAGPFAFRFRDIEIKSPASHAAQIFVTTLSRRAFAT
jgi:hypothetical protein